MKIHYDRETDSLLITFSAGIVDESDESRTGVILDYNSQGQLLSIEVLQASQQIIQPAKIEYEAV